MVIDVKRFIPLFLIFLCFIFAGCKNTNFLNEDVVSVNIKSEYINQIQSIDDVRLDRIVLELEFENNKLLHVVLENDMVENLLDLNSVGHHKIVLTDKYLNYSIDLIIYDDVFLSDNYIYYYELDNEKHFIVDKSIYNLDEPSSSGKYFMGWYKDIKLEEIYFDAYEHIVCIYPKFSLLEVFKISFFIDGNSYINQYINSGGTINYPKLDEDVYWDFEGDKAYSDMVINGFTKKDDKVIIKYYDDTGLIHIGQYDRGSNVEYYPDNIPLGYEFVSWNVSLENVMDDMSVFAIYEKNKYLVRFFDIDGNLLYKEEVSHDEDANFVFESDIYYVTGYSKSIENVTSDSDVIVYLKSYINYYYVDADYSFSEYAEIGMPDCADRGRNKFVGWDKDKDDPHKFYAVFEETGQVFNLIVDSRVFTITYEMLDSYPVDVCIFIKKGIAASYSWYSDIECSIPSDSPDMDKNWNDYEITLYGKKTNEACASSYQLIIEDLVITQIEGLKSNTLYESLFIDNDNAYLGFDVSCVYKSFQFVMIDSKISTISNVDDISGFKCYFIVSKNNPYYYSEGGIIYDKESNEPIFDCWK